jgi:hypothetical protein
MSKAICMIALLACLPGGRTYADPIHAVADGAYWHHDSHWVFPEKAGTFVRVGIPQDVAGSEDAAAHYAHVEDGVRHTASVNVYRANSMAAAEHESAMAGQLSSEGAFLVSEANKLSGIRRIYSGNTADSGLTGMYVVNAGEWRVAIRISGSSVETMDAFVRAQRWETLGEH